MRRLLAALLASPALLIPAAAPAQATSCADARGVEVVVEYDALGAADAVDCAPGLGGRVAAEIFEATGHHQEQVQRYPGAVCRVDGVPADVSCYDMPPADHYWALFWSDGSGGWVYSQLGAYSLKVPEGGKVAWVWQDTNDRNTPSQASTRPRPSSGTTTGPGPQPGATPAPGSGQPGPPAPTSTARSGDPATSPTTGSATGPASDPTTAEGRGAGAAPRAPGTSPRHTRGPEPSVTTPTASARAEAGQGSADPPAGVVDVATTNAAGGLPLPAVVGVLLLLAVLAAGTAWWRRTR